MTRDEKFRRLQWAHCKAAEAIEFALANPAKHLACVDSHVRKVLERLAGQHRLMEVGAKAARQRHP